MPRATLSFRLPEERDEFETAQKAGAYKSTLWDFGEFLRSKIKHGEMSEEKREIYVEIREQFASYMSDNEVEI